MPIVNIDHANHHLSRLLAQAEAGEEIIIARDGKPVARLVRYQPIGERRFGAWRDRIAIDDSFFDPLPEEEMAG